MSAQPQTIDNGGGVIVDITNITLAKRLDAIRVLMRSVIRTANQGHRHLPRLTVKPDQFASLMRAANKGRDKNAPCVIGLALDGVPIAAMQVLS